MTAEIQAMIEGLCKDEAALINKAYEFSEDLGNTAVSGAILSFEDMLRQSEGSFVRGAKIEYRHFVVHLLECIEEKYRGPATAVTLLT